MPDLFTVYLSSEGIDRTHYFGESVVVGFQHYIVEASLVSGGFQVNSTNSHDTIVAYLERVIFFPGAHHTRIKITSRLLFKRTLTPGLFNFCMIITSTSLKHLTQQQTFCVLSLDPEQTTPHPPQHPIHTPKPNTPPPYSPSHRTHTVPSVNSLSDIYMPNSPIRYLPPRGAGRNRKADFISSLHRLPQDKNHYHRWGFLKICHGWGRLTHGMSATMKAAVTVIGAHVFQVIQLPPYLDEFKFSLSHMSLIDREIQF